MTRHRPATQAQHTGAQEAILCGRQISSGSLRTQVIPIASLKIATVRSERGMQACRWLRRSSSTIPRSFGAQLKQLAWSSARHPGATGRPSAARRLLPTLLSGSRRTAWGRCPQTPGPRFARGCPPRLHFTAESRRAQRGSGSGGSAPRNHPRSISRAAQNGQPASGHRRPPFYSEKYRHLRENDASSAPTPPRNFRPNISSVILLVPAWTGPALVAWGVSLS